jgi:erythromycin esterase-like protein
MFDLSQFSELRQKSVIGIGESAHGSVGFHKVTRDLVISAVESLGTNVIGIEAPMGIVEQLNRKISRESKAPVTIDDIRDLYPIWRSRPILELLNWIYEYNHQKNLEAGREIFLIGYDVRLPAPELIEIGLWAGADSKISNLRLEELKEIEMMSYRGQPENAKKAIQQILTKVEDSVGDKAPTERIKLLVDRIRAWGSVYLLWSEKGVDLAYAERDKYMAWLLEEQVKKHPLKGPVVIFAHLNHLIFNNLKVENAKSHVVAGPVMGAHLKKKFGSKYSLIGLFAKNLELSNASVPVTKFIAKNESLEGQLAEKYSRDVLLRVHDLSKSIPSTVTVGKVQPEKSALLETMATWTARIEEQFDYIAFVLEAKSESPL